MLNADVNSYNDIYHHRCTISKDSSEHTILIKVFSIAENYFKSFEYKMKVIKSMSLQM